MEFTCGFMYVFNLFDSKYFGAALASMLVVFVVGLLINMFIDIIKL